MSLSYAWEKFFIAVHGAVSSEEPLQKRLADAYAYNIIHVRNENVPAAIWSRIEKLNRAVTKNPPVGTEGSITASTSAMSAEEAGKWLQEVVSIFNEIAEANYGSRSR